MRIVYFANNRAGAAVGLLAGTLIALTGPRAKALAAGLAAVAFIAMVAFVFPTIDAAASARRGHAGPAAVTHGRSDDVTTTYAPRRSEMKGHGRAR